MSSDAPNADVTPKSLSWESLDAPIKRAGVIVGIVVGLLTLVTHYIIPYIDAFSALCHVAVIGWWGYKWWTKPEFLSSWYLPHTFAIIAGLSFLSLGLQTTVTENRIRIQPMGLFSLLTGCAWVAMSIVAAYEYHKDVIGQQRDLWRAISQMADTQGGMLRINAAQDEIVKYNHKQLETLATNTAQKLSVEKYELFREPSLPS